MGVLRLQSLVTFRNSTDNYNAGAATRAGPGWVARTRRRKAGRWPLPQNVMAVASQVLVDSIDKG